MANVSFIPLCLRIGLAAKDGSNRALRIHGRAYLETMAEMDRPVPPNYAHPMSSQIRLTNTRQAVHLDRWR